MQQIKPARQQNQEIQHKISILGYEITTVHACVYSLKHVPLLLVPTPLPREIQIKYVKGLLRVGYMSDYFISSFLNFPEEIIVVSNGLL